MLSGGAGSAGAATEKSNKIMFDNSSVYVLVQFNPLTALVVSRIYVSIICTMYTKPYGQIQRVIVHVKENVRKRKYEL